MVRIRTLLIGAAAGAALAYLFDPDRGLARRTGLRDHFEDMLRAVVPSGSRAPEPPSGGVELASAPAPPAADDLTVLNRVESVIFGLPDVPRGSVEVEVVDGALVLRGEVESEEGLRRVEQVASRVPGVTACRSLLRVRSAGVPGQAARSQAG